MWRVGLIINQEAITDEHYKRNYNKIIKAAKELIEYLEPHVEE